MGDLSTKGSNERNAVLAQLRGLTEEQQYDLWGELWEEKHRRTFMTIKPLEVEAPPPPPPPPRTPVPSDPSHISERDFVEMELLSERPLPPPPPHLRGFMREARGIEYVVGGPQGSPVLRCLKQSLYDKLIVPESGFVNRVTLFDDHRFFPDHSPKTEKDTNMTCSGQLGFPLEYDLSWIDLKFEKFSHPDDIRRVLKGLVFKWIRGCNTPWLRVTLSGFEPLLMTEGVLSDSLKDHVTGQLADFKLNGIWTRYRVSVKTPDNLPQRISSNEAFRVEVSSPDGGLGELHGPVHLKVLLGDTLYAQI